MFSGNYRYYCLDVAGYLHSAEGFYADSDEDAIAQIEAEHPGDKCEIWQGDRLVAKLPSSPSGLKRNLPRPPRRPACPSLSSYRARQSATDLFILVGERFPVRISSLARSSAAARPDASLQVRWVEIASFDEAFQCGGEDARPPSIARSSEGPGVSG